MEATSGETTPRVKNGVSFKSMEDGVKIPELVTHLIF